MNPRPKFCVGEEVIIQAINVTEYNGQTHEILRIEWWGHGVETLDGEFLPPGYVYFTTSDELSWVESTLRKLPPKADPWKDCAFNPLKLTV